MGVTLLTAASLTLAVSCCLGAGGRDGLLLGRLLFEQRGNHWLGGRRAAHRCAGASRPRAAEVGGCCWSAGLCWAPVLESQPCPALPCAGNAGFTSVTFTDNQALNGGAVGVGGSSTGIYFTSCTFTVGGWVGICWVVGWMGEGLLGRWAAGWVCLAPESERIFERVHSERCHC